MSELINGDISSSTPFSVFCSDFFPPDLKSHYRKFFKIEKYIEESSISQSLEDTHKFCFLVVYTLFPAHTHFSLSFTKLRSYLYYNIFCEQFLKDRYFTNLRLDFLITSVNIISEVSVYCSFLFVCVCLCVWIFFFPPGWVE